MSAVQSDASDVLRVNKLNTEAGIRNMPFASFQARGGAHCMECFFYFEASMYAYSL